MKDNEIEHQSAPDEHMLGWFGLMVLGIVLMVLLVSVATGIVDSDVFDQVTGPLR